MDNVNSPIVWSKINMKTIKNLIKPDCVGTGTQVELLAGWWNWTIVTMAAGLTIRATRLKTTS